MSTMIGLTSDVSAARLKRQLGERGKICFVSGNFNVLHPGHVRLLKFASELGECLVVGVNPDHTHGVTVPGRDRVLQFLSV